MLQREKFCEIACDKILFGRGILSSSAGDTRGVSPSDARKEGI